jgi:hypothetical protein
MPEDLRVRLAASARLHERSLNSEIVTRLEGSFDAEAIGSQRGVNRMKKGSNRAVAVAAVVAVLAAVAAVVAAATHTSAKPSIQDKLASKLARPESQGGNNPTGDESAELLAAQQQWDNQRTQGSIVAPGAYNNAYTGLMTLDVTGGNWSELTRLPYDADDPDYRDFYSNSSGGSGLVTGRITGLAADGYGYVYAAAADGGVWRSATGGGNWVPIADSLPTLSSGDLELASDGSLWYATGEANTGGTSYVGTGVYRLANPRTGSFAPASRVGGEELESTTINSLRFSNGKVWAATLRGIYSHPLGDYTARWTRVWSPQPSYLPGGANAGAQNAAYMNIVNDLVVDPKNADHLLAAVGWRSGAAYNGFYESTDGGATWNRVNPGGGLDATDVGYANFAYSSDGSTLYVINQSPRMLNSFGGGRQQSLLDGVYSSTNGLLGPWNKIASPDKLGATSTGSALANVNGQGYSPGVQAWYNQFIAVDPADAKHVFVGLEEIYETTDGGTHWRTVGPYWNFGQPCWTPDVLYAPNGSKGCPLTTHSDQHAITFGSYRGTQTMYVGNDGGAYKRPLNGHVNSNGNATDWVSLNDGSIDALQYYYVGVGKLNTDDAQRPDIQSGDNVLVSGGLQDNGGSLLRPRAAKMVSNFGGDGGDVLVDPNDGCNIAQEYIYLSIEVTKNCANNSEAIIDLSKSTTVDVSPPDINAQFIAPFTANEKNVNQWVAGGNALWYQDKGFDIASGSDWKRIHTLASSSQTFTAVSFSGDTVLATWCGPCSNSTAATFKRGAVLGKRAADGTWTWSNTIPSTDMSVPNRFLQGAAINPRDEKDVFVVANGFSRKFSEGPGAGLGHVYESKNGGPWTDISGNFPDIPSSDIVVLPSGGLVVATDLGVVYRSARPNSVWTRLGGNLPVTTAMDLSVGPDGNLYVATHGRGIWRISAAGL